MNRLHRRNKRRKLFWNIFTICAIVFIGYVVVRSFIKIANIKSNKVVITGIVTGVSSNQRNTGGGVKFTYTVNGIDYKASTAYPNLSISFCESLVGRHFPVIYSAKHKKWAQMLLTRERFTEYNMEQPDSLAWIENYVRER
jgi:hypothetical protein